MRLPAYSPTNGHGVTVADVISCFLSHNPARTRAASVLQKRLLEFVQSFGTKPAVECTPADLLLWLDARSDRYKTDWTRLSVINNIKRPFNWAVRDARLIPYNPFECVTHPEGEPTREMEPGELQTILRNSRAVFRRIVLYLRFTGCRPSEAADLEWSHVDEQRGCVTLWNHKTRNSRRQKRPRVIVLHPVALKLLRWIRRHKPHPTFVFVNARGTKWTRYTLCKRIKRLRKRLGCKSLRSLYGLRHAMGCSAVLNDVPLPVVAEILGHSNIRTTMRYVHVKGKVDLIRNAIVQAMRRT